MNTEDHQFACWLEISVSRGVIKNYKRIKTFINKYKKDNKYQTDIESLIDLEYIKPTNQIKKFIKQFKLLSYKCSDESINDYMIMNSES